MSDPIEQLRYIFSEHPAGLAATKPLRAGVRVGLKIHGNPEHFTFERTPEGTKIVSGQLEGTDFDLTMGLNAVEAICSTKGSGVGDFGVSFLRTLMREQAEEKVTVRLHAGLITLTRHGYLKVMAMGGPKVLGFLSKEGYIGPRGIAKAVRRLRNS